MFKKNVWVAGLITALVIMLVGCVDAFVDEGGGVEVEVFNLETVLADVGDTVIGSDADWTKIFGGTPFLMCGGTSNGTYEIKGHKVQVSKFGPDWGVGFDLAMTSRDGAAGAGFKAGDKIFVKGSSSAPGLILNLESESGETRLGDVDLPEGDFEKEFTLTAGDISKIRAGAKQSIRIHYKAGNGTSRKGTIAFEQITINGLRSAADVEIPPDFTISNVGDYNVNAVKPDAKVGEVYIDLSTAVKFNLTPSPNDFVAYVDKDPQDETDPGALYAKFTSKLDGIFIPFTEAVKTQLQNAVKNQFTFSVVIDGSTDAAATATNANVRWCFGQDTGSSWNISNMTQSDNFAKALKSTLNEFSVVDNMKGIVIQAGGGNVADIAPYTIRINSIKVTLNAPSKTVNGLSFSMKVPAGGATAPTAVTGTGFTGTITWIPPLPPNGKWALSTVYSATIAITPNTDYAISSTIGDATINGTAAQGTYNQFTKQLLVGPFAATAATPVPLPAFTFSADEKFKTLADGTSIGNWSGWSSSILDAAGALQSSGGTTTVSKVGEVNYIKQVYTDNWNGIDLLDSYFSFEPGDVIKVVIQLQAATHNGGSNDLNVLLNGAPNGWGPIGATVDIKPADIASNLNKDITIERTLTAANIATINGDNGKCIRIRVNNVTNTGATVLYKEISVTGNGRVAP